MIPGKYPRMVKRTLIQKSLLGQSGMMKQSKVSIRWSR